ncbi:amidohydrolase family protein [Alkalimonas collagenimarina]|uniref:Amidohydrolase family protein n=1 Tax=Alkalimonas collagenimarina TaxID=400390 RepID=A0ABT9H313_9GAMM|nr:amidohydrolase family protein [Alkalimonas collagenimarina]MDP4537710.1 amidohydrolase family protein [Alkalimonas collagenimarina]
MRTLFVLLLGSLAYGALAASAVAEQRPIAFVGATLIPIEGEPVEQGTLLVAGGKILALGRDVAIPANADVRQVDGKVIMPGLVDTHSHIGQVAGADRSAPIQADVRALDSINVRHAGIIKARAGGITTVNVMPGSGHLLSGQTLYMKLREGNSVEDLAIRNAAGGMMGGIKMANGTNPLRASPFPGTRGKAAALMRTQLIAAQEYCKKLASDDKPSRNLGNEALCEALAGERLVHHHTHRHDDVLTVLRIAEEFGLRVVLHHVSEAGLVADEIAAAGVPASIIHIDSPGGKLEVMNLEPDNGRLLAEAGVLLAYHTDDPITDSRLFLRSAGMGMRFGLDRDTALASLTINGAKMLDLDERVGSLVAGKDADFVILDGDPLSVYTRVLETWIDGTQVFNLDDPEHAIYATGGYGAGRDAIASDIIMMEAGL